MSLRSARRRALSDPSLLMALVITAVVLPVAVILVVAGKLSEKGIGQDAHVGPAVVSQRDAGSGRADLPPLPVEAPPVTAEADAACPSFMGKIPLTLLDEPSRPVQSESPFAYAWGEPPIVLVCGAGRPVDLIATSPLMTINGVSWHVDLSQPGEIVWTAVDRPVYVSVTVPAQTDSAPVTVLSDIIGATLPVVAVH